MATTATTRTRRPSGRTVVEVPAAYVEVLPAPDQTLLRAIRDIVSAMESCTVKRCLLNETGRVPWSYLPLRRHINGYAHFSGPATSPPPAAARAAVTAPARNAPTTSPVQVETFVTHPPTNVHGA